MCVTVDGLKFLSQINWYERGAEWQEVNEVGRPIWKDPNKSLNAFSLPTGKYSVVAVTHLWKDIHAN